jgi:hypothetical protein
MIRLPRLAVLRAFVTLCCILLGFRYFSTSDKVVIAEENGAHSPEKTWSRREFIEASQAALSENDFDQSHIQALCARQSWVPDLVFECSMIQGGIGKFGHSSLWM